MSNNSERPFLTFALFAYNQEQFIREAVAGAFAQTYARMEIILSDDCSTDRTFEIMQEMAASYHGAKQVTLNRNPTNLGLIGHVNLVTAMARADYIIAAAGDDISNSDRTELIARKIEAERPMLIHSDFSAIDVNGCPVEYDDFDRTFDTSTDVRIAATSLGMYVGGTGTWHKDLFRKYGPITVAGAFEDLVLGFRAALEGGISYIDRPVVQYRFGVGISHVDGGTKSAMRNHNEAKAKARHASLQQRLLDSSMHNSSDTRSLQRIIRKEMLIQSGKYDLYARPWVFVTCSMWHPSMILYILSVARRNLVSQLQKAFRR